MTSGLSTVKHFMTHTNESSLSPIHADPFIFYKKYAILDRKLRFYKKKWQKNADFYYENGDFWPKIAHFFWKKGRIFIQRW